MSAPYEIRAGGDGKSKKQSMAELKLRRLTELNARLKEDLDRRRIPVSEAALEYGSSRVISRTDIRTWLTVDSAVSSHLRTRSQKTGWCHHAGGL